MGQKSRFISPGPPWEKGISSTVIAVSSADTLEIRGREPDPPDILQSHTFSQQGWIPLGPL